MKDNFRDTYRQYLKDESRTEGYADSISFPKSETEVSEDLKNYCGRGIPVTVQGARTGLTGGCVPFGGHILNTSGLDRFLGMELDDDGSFLIRVQPAVPLSRLRTLLTEKSLPAEGWSQESLAVYEQFRTAAVLGDLRASCGEDLLAAGADRVFLVTHETLKLPMELPYEEILYRLVSREQPDILLFGATPFGRSLAPRLAARLGTGLTADCTSLSIDPGF